MAPQNPIPPADASDSFYRSLFQDAPVALILTDPGFRIRSANAPSGALLGVSAEKMVGRFLWSLVPAQRQRLLERLLQRTVDRGELSEFNADLRDARGKPRHLAVLLSPLRDETGAHAGIAAWVIDETQRQHLAERVAQMEKMASLGTLAGGIAHHFNNILGGVATFVDFALTSDDPAIMKRALALTAEAVTRATKITQSLLAFAAYDHLTSDLADLTEVLMHFANTVEGPLAEKSIRLRVDLKPVPVVAVDSNRMHRVLGNLLTNAEEAMPNGGEVSLGLDRDGPEAVITFADTGRGIEAKDLPLVFEPFFTTKGLLAGGSESNQGLGLSIVHGVVTEMGGRILVESKPGEFTRLTIRIPIPPESVEKK